MPKEIPVHSRLRPYLACFAASLFSFYDLFQLSVLNSISMPLLQHFHLSTGQLGMFASVFLLANVLGLLFLGSLIDRYSVRNIALVFLSLSVLASFGFAYSNSLLLDIVCRSLQGLASAASLLICIRTTTQWFKNNSNLALGVGIAIAIMGGVIGNLAFTNLVLEYGWRNSMVLAGALGVFVWLFLFKFLYDPRDNQDASSQSISMDIWSLIKYVNRHSIYAGLYLGLMSAPLFILGALWGNYYLVHTYRITVAMAAWSVSLFFIGMILGSPLWGLLADSWLGRVKTMYLGTLICLLISVSLLVVNGSYHSIEILFFSLGFSSSVQNLTYAWISEKNPIQIVSTATAVTAVLLNCIGVILQPAFGWVIGHTTSGFGLALISAAFLIALLLISLMRKITNQQFTVLTTAS